MLNEVLEVWFVTVPEFPLAAEVLASVNVCPGKVTTSLLIVPTVWLNVPKFVVPFVTPAMTTSGEPAVFVILTDTPGLPPSDA